MKIGKKLLISFTIIVAFLLISAGITLIYTLRINNQLEEITENINPLESDIQDMISILWKSNYIVQRYSTEDDKEILQDLRFEFEHINSLFTEKADFIEISVKSSVITEKVAHSINKHQTFFKLAKKLMDNRDADLQKGVIYGESSIVVQYSIAKQLERDVVDSVESLQEALEEFTAIKQESNKKSDAVVRNAILVIFLMTLLSFLVAIFVWSSLTKSITRPIKSLSEAASKLSKGNFDINIDVGEEEDELSELSFTFNQMVLSLRKIIHESPRLKRFINIKKKQDKSTQKYIVEPGVSYLIKDSTSADAYEIITDKTESGYNPLLVTRQNPKIVEQRYGIPKKNIVWLSDEKEKGFKTSSNLNDIQKEIVDFISKNEKTIILMDRSDYILNKYGFENFLRFVTNLNDKVMSKGSTLLIPVDPAIFNDKQLSLLEKELLSPAQQAVDVLLSEELITILKFISDRSAINKPATYKDVGSHFSITAPTTQKKIEELNQGGFITISKIGRNKILKLTRYGERVLANK